MARPPTAASVLRNMKKQTFEPKTEIASEMFIPNHSGISSHPEAKAAFVNKADLLDEAYWDGAYNIVLSQTITGIAMGSIYYRTRFSNWIENKAKNWSESGGEWTYSGNFPPSGVRKFLFTYHFTEDKAATSPHVTTLARVTKDVGAGHIEVSGSVQASEVWSSLSAFGSIFIRHQVSNSFIVSIEEGDKLAFQVGYLLGGSGTYNLSLLFTTLFSFPLLPVKGYHVTITAIDGQAA